MVDVQPAGGGGSVMPRSWCSLDVSDVGYRNLELDKDDYDLASSSSGRGMCWFLARSVPCVFALTGARPTCTTSLAVDTGVHCRTKSRGFYDNCY